VVLLLMQFRHSPRLGRSEAVLQGNAATLNTQSITHRYRLHIFRAAECIGIIGGLDAALEIWLICAESTISLSLYHFSRTHMDRDAHVLYSAGVCAR